MNGWLKEKANDCASEQWTPVCEKRVEQDSSSLFYNSRENGLLAFRSPTMQHSDADYIWMQEAALSNDYIKQGKLKAIIGLV